MDLSVEVEKELHDFFLDISLHISDQMRHMAEEETLSYLLCALMDPENQLSTVLAKSPKVLQMNLSKGETPVRFGIELNLHSRNQEYKVSGADIGLIFNLQTPEGEETRSAVLLQAKRLQPKNNMWGLKSRYSTKFDQHQKLLNLAKNYEKECSVQYLLYNPCLSFFLDWRDLIDQERCYLAKPIESHCHIDLQRDEKALSRFTGLRVIPASLFSSKEIKNLSLKDCYSKTIGLQTKFLTFADFLVDQIKGGEGVTAPEFIEIAEGKNTSAGFKPRATLNFTIKQN